MTHDPEFNFLLNDQLNDLLVQSENVKKLIPPDDTLNAVLKGMDYLLAIAVEIRKDYNECFNETKKEFLRSEFKKTMVSINEANDAIKRALE